MRKLLYLVFTALMVSSVFSQSNYNGQGGGASDLVVSLVADSDNFSGKEIVISNYVFANLAFFKSVGYYKGNPWFDDSKTVRIDDASMVFKSNDVVIYFHPQKDDMGALKLVVLMKGRQYSVPYKVGIKGKAYKVQFPNNPKMFTIILIEELDLNGDVFRGEIPDTLVCQ